MSENCTNECSGCTEQCDKRLPQKEQTNDFTSIRKTIAVVSGKGGVGKSLVTSFLACAANSEGYRTAILDADVTGPSIPKAFGLTGRVYADENNLLIPVSSDKGVKIMSVNLLLQDESDPVTWRGPVISGTVTQFYKDVRWGDVDVMLIDCPPGTGDVALTLFNNIKLDGIIIVTSPQELVSMIVKKAVRMAKIMNVPILGIVENMSYFVCGKCGEKHYIFGKSELEEVAKEAEVKNIERIPIDPEIANYVDSGMVELYKENPLKDFFLKIDKEL